MNCSVVSEIIKFVHAHIPRTYHHIEATWCCQEETNTPNSYAVEFEFFHEWRSNDCYQEICPLKIEINKLTDL
jgi:hypothetical protein